MKIDKLKAIFIVICFSATPLLTEIQGMEERRDREVPVHNIPNENLPFAVQYFPSELFLPPESIDFKAAKNFPGISIVSKKFFKEGEEIYKTFSVPWLKEFPENIQFFINGQKFTHNRDFHSYQSKDKVALYSGWDCFINHSCDPNTTSVDCTLPSQKEEKFFFTVVALKPIAPGDEITCDYNTFEWDSLPDQQIEKCFCGSDICLSKNNIPIKGMKYLPPVLQKQKFSISTPEIQEAITMMNSCSGPYL